MGIEKLHSKYLLLADKDDKILHLQEAALNYFYGGSIVLANSKEEILKILIARGKPELICVDFSLLKQDEAELHNYLEKNQLHIPVIACTDNQEDHNEIGHFPMASALLEKPISTDSFIYLVKGITTTIPISPGYVPIRMETILEYDLVNFELFLKLSGTNFVRILNEGDTFSKTDAEKLQAKGIKEVHIKASDSHIFLNAWENKLKAALVDKAKSLIEKNFVAMDTLEQLESVSKAMGWTREVVMAAEKTITDAVAILTKESNLNATLKMRLSVPTSKYSMHVSMLSYLNCCFSSHLGWSSETQTKLAMASLLHDLALDEKFYDNAEEWNKKAANLKDKNPETVKYRLHAMEASKLAQALDILPPDVDQIILQHHEIKDGTGFPRGLTYARISQLSSLFIMVEDLIKYITYGYELEASIQDYLVWGEIYYDKGHFKKIFDQIKEKLPK